MSESRLVALARQAQNLQPERRSNTLSELRGRWSDYVNPYQTPPQQLSDLANPLRWPAMAVEGIQTAVETVPRMLQPGYDYSNTRQAAEDAFNVAGVVGAGSLLGTAAKPANAVGTFGGKLGGAAGDLDMSQAARMARAKEMGFDTEQVLYHGTGAKNIESFYPSAKGELGPGVYFADDPNYAHEWGKRGGGDQSIIPVYVRGDIAEVDRLDWLAASLAEGETPKSLNERISSDGFSGMTFVDGAGKRQTIVFDPSNIRSVNAAFDPAKSDSANLLASRGAPVPVEQRRRRDKDEIF